MLLKLVFAIILLHIFIFLAGGENDDDTCICPQKSVTILCNDTTIINGNGTYCDNFKCVYNLIPPSSTSNCPTTHYKITVGIGLRPALDYLIFKNNEKFIQKFDRLHFSQKNIQFYRFTSNSDITSEFYFTVSNNYSFELNSGISPSPPKPTDNWFWFVTVDPIPAPKFNSVILNNINSRYVLWLPDMIKNDALIVCNNDTTKMLKMFSTYTQFGGLENFALYDGQNLNNFVQNLKDGNSPISLPTARSAISSSQCFTIYASEIFRPLNSGNTVLFMAVDNDSTQNCQTTENTVFQMITTGNDEFELSIKSTEKGSCEMIILAVTEAGTDLPHIWIRNISTSSNNNGQYIFKSTVNDMVLLNLTAADFPDWKEIGIYTPALSIVAPPSADISVHISAIDQSQKWISIDSNNLQRGIFTSPSYCGFMRNFDNYQLYHSLSIYTQKLIKVDHKVLIGNPNIVFSSDGKAQNLNSNLTSTIISSNFSINYTEIDAYKNSFLIQYSITNVKIDTETTTTNNSNDFRSQISLYVAIVAVLVCINNF